MVNAAVPPSPAGFDPEAFFAGIHWHQGWELFDGVHLPGRNPVDVLCDYAGVPHDLTGRRVLDVGAWHGAFSFECERRGAAEVVALSPEPPEVTGFTKLKQILGSKVEYRMGSVYGLDPAVLGTFDLVLFFGVLYHLRYPMLAIDRVRSVASADVLIETHVCDPWLLEPAGPSIGADLQKVPLWRFYPGAELLGDPSNWFGPNVQAVIAACETAGFATTHVKSWVDRATFHARVESAPRLQGTYEGDYELIRESVEVTANL